MQVMLLMAAPRDGELVGDVRDAARLLSVQGEGDPTGQGYQGNRVKPRPPRSTQPSQPRRLAASSSGSNGTTRPSMAVGWTWLKAN